MKAERQQKERTSRVIQPSKGGGGRIVDNRSSSVLQERIIDAIQQKKVEKETCLGKKSGNTVQLQCNPQQLAWQANYMASGMSINDLFTDDDLINYASPFSNVTHTLARGVFAHEYIQGANPSWTAEYGIPPTVGYIGWSYSDMVNNGDIYEIKPNGGTEDAVTQATNYVNKANANPARPRDHQLSSVAIQNDVQLLQRRIGVRDYYVNLSYGNHADGEILYRWSVASRAIVGNEKKKVIAAKGCKDIRDFFSTAKPAKETVKKAIRKRGVK